MNIPLSFRPSNEQEVLPLSYPRLKAVMDTLGDYELIFINDGSRDGTLSMLKEIAEQDKNVRVLSFSRNFGHQEAVSAGMAHTSGQAVIIIDCDLQDPPELIPDMVKKWEAGADIVYGQRVRREGETAFKKLTAWAYYRILRALGGQYIPANTGDFRLIDRKVCDTLNAMPEKNRFLRGMAAWSGFKAEPIEFVREERAAGQTKYSLKKMPSWRRRHRVVLNKPLKAPLAVGIALWRWRWCISCCPVFAAIGLWDIVHVLLRWCSVHRRAVRIARHLRGCIWAEYDDERATIYIIDEKINSDREVL